MSAHSAHGSRSHIPTCQNYDLPLAIETIAHHADKNDAEAPVQLVQTTTDRGPMIRRSDRVSPGPSVAIPRRSAGRLLTTPPAQHFSEDKRRSHLQPTMAHSTNRLHEQSRATE